MRILVVAATHAEIAPLVAGLRQRPGDGSHIHRYARGAHEVDVLATGVGMVATAARCSRTLASGDYDLAFNFGICGSFDPALPPASVVHVVTERLPELGAEDGDAFLTAEELNLVDANQFPFEGARIVNVVRPVNAVLDRLPSVNGITVNTAHGSERTIAAIRARCAPQVESMEGAAFMYSCLIRHLPCAEVRAVSNVVERRNRGAWKVQEAIAALGDTALAILDQA
jgi:futalosine hydrolase